MKFIDPWASFQYMGGALTIHVFMSFYIHLEIGLKKDSMDFL